VTLLHQAPLPLALAHQVLAILVFSVAVIHAERLSHRGGSLAADRRQAEQGA
jgi:cytochrome c oxidase assembly protein subunit 15